MFSELCTLYMSHVKPTCHTVPENQPFLQKLRAEAYVLEGLIALVK